MQHSASGDTFAVTFKVLFSYFYALSVYCIVLYCCSIETWESLGMWYLLHTYIVFTVLFCLLAHVTKRNSWVCIEVYAKVFSCQRSVQLGSDREGERESTVKPCGCFSIWYDKSKQLKPKPWHNNRNKLQHLLAKYAKQAKTLRQGS